LRLAPEPGGGASKRIQLGVGDSCSVRLRAEGPAVAGTAFSAGGGRSPDSEQRHAGGGRAGFEVRRGYSSICGEAMKADRRQFVTSVAGAAAGVAVSWPLVRPNHRVSYLKPRSRVAVLEATEYSEGLELLLMDGLRLFGLDIRGRSVLLKPNLVEHLAGAP